MSTWGSTHAPTTSEQSCVTASIMPLAAGFSGLGNEPPPPRKATRDENLINREDEENNVREDEENNVLGNWLQHSAYIRC